MAFLNPGYMPQPGQYFVPGPPYAGQPMFPGLPYPTYPRYGNTVYKYHTPDGGPPNMGAPPRKPDEGGLGHYWPGAGAFGNPFATSGFGYPAPPPPPEVTGQDDPKHKHDETCQSQRRRKCSGNNCRANIRVFQNNILLNNQRNADGLVTVPGQSKVEPWRLCRDMTVEELIEKLDCIERANYHNPYPRYAIGIQEVFPQGRNRFREGTRIMLNDDRASLTIGDIWPNATDDTPECQLPYIVRLPVCT